MTNDRLKIRAAASGTAGASITFTSAIELLTNGRILLPSLLGTSSTLSSVMYDTTTKELVYSTSARRYKDRITDIELDSSIIFEFRLRSFDPVRPDTGAPDGPRTFGLIADETEALLKEKGVDPRLFIGYLNGAPEVVYYHQLVIPLLAEVQKLRRELDIMKEELRELR